MGSSQIFFLSLSFLLLETIIFSSLFINTQNPTFEIGSSLKVLDIQPPKAPNFNTPWWGGGVLGDTAQAIVYGASLTVFALVSAVNIFAMPLAIVSQVLTFSAMFPFLAIINLVVIGLLGYSLIGKLTGGSD